MCACIYIYIYIYTHDPPSLSRLRSAARRHQLAPWNSSLIHTNNNNNNDNNTNKT